MGTRNSVWGTWALLGAMDASVTGSFADYEISYSHASHRMKQDLVKAARNHQVKTQRPRHYSEADHRGTYCSYIAIRKSELALTKLIPGDRTIL